MSISCIVIAGSRPWNEAAVESLTRNLSARILSFSTRESLENYI